MYTILITITIICFFLFNYIIIYNELIHYNSRLEHSEKSIEDQLHIKISLLSDINIELTKILDRDDYLSEYINIQQEQLSNHDIDIKLEDCMKLINEIQCDNKILDNKKINKILKSIKKNDELLTASKNFYNKNSVSLSIYIKKFPNNIIAKNHGIKTNLVYGKKNMQDTLLDDFKI